MDRPSTRRRIADLPYISPIWSRIWPFLWPGALLAILAFLVLYPLAMLLLGALTDLNPVADRWSGADLSLGNFASVLANPNVQEALLDSLVACTGGTALAVAIGLGFGWIAMRSNTPWKRVIATSGLVPLFAPPLVAGVAWAILGSPRTGLINTLLASLGVSWRINLYSLPGLVAVFGLYYAPYVYLFTSAALSNMDPALEEAAEVAGAGPGRTFLTVTLPLIAPAVISGMLLSFVVMLGIYGIPAVLGAPANIPVLTTYIFNLTAWSPPRYGAAAAVSLLLMVVTGVLVLAQQRALAGRSFTTIAGKGFRPRARDLGPWRFVALGLALLYLAVVVVLPSLALVIAAFRKFLFIRDMGALVDVRQYGLLHFERLFANPLTLRSIVNTLEVGVITALAGGALALALGYTVHRSRVPLRRAIEIIATLPAAIPGLVIGVAYLWAWIGLPGGLYGTIWILALAFIARFIPDCMRALSTSLLQIHRELEEAAWICGRGPLATIRTIVLPLARPGIVAAMTLLFILAIRELGSSLFLYSSDSMVMAVLLLDYYDGGNIGITAAFSLVQTALLAVLIGLAHRLSRGAADSGVGRAG